MWNGQDQFNLCCVRSYVWLLIFIKLLDGLRKPILVRHSFPTNKGSFESLSFFLFLVQDKKKPIVFISILHVYNTQQDSLYYLLERTFLSYLGNIMFYMFKSGNPQIKNPNYSIANIACALIASKSYPNKS